MIRYLVVFGSTIAVFVLLAAFTAFTVNPYDYWDIHRRTGFNEYKPAAGRHLASAKVKQALRIKPATIVIGNSRVDVGFDPLSDAWPTTMRPVYNFGLPGRSTADVISDLDDVLVAHKPDNILLALDFLDFRSRDRSGKSSASSMLPAMEHLQLLNRILLSSDALVDSVTTVLEQHKQFPASWSPEGFNSLAEYQTIVAAEGHRAIFDQREFENLKSYVDPNRSLEPSKQKHPEVIAMRNFLDRMNGEGIDVVMVIHPYHANILAAFRATGLWDDFIQWKRWMTLVAADANVRLVDYSAYGEPTKESIPDAGDTSTRLQFYWEAGHYKSSLGDLVIKDLQKQAPVLGIELTPESIDAAIDLMDTRAIDYELEHPDTIRRIVSRVRRLRGV